AAASVSLSVLSESDVDEDSWITFWNGYLTKRRKSKQKATKSDTGWKSV
ncbi:hypothetical protein Tco_0342262, partial [Tanacetum coccineum]